MKKPGIPPYPKPEEDRTRFDSSMKECVESIMGRRSNQIQVLDPTTATLADCVSKINEILDTIQ
tara:strand:- start:6450 stop:6641 length:192 start_codon:yes stop_codon:yes gene_type:complete